MRRPGLALILVVGVLGILAVLGSAFAVLSRLERRAAQQRILGTRAWLLARSGIEDAQARLDMGQDPDAPANRYGGEDWDLSGGPLSAFEAPNEVYRPGFPDRDACPAEHALRPSFFIRMGSGNPVTAKLNGRERGSSGMLGNSRSQYALKVSSQAGIYLNGGDPSFRSDPTSVSDYNTNLRRMLGVLAEAVKRVDGNTAVGQADGWALIDGRPKEGWGGWSQVRDLALGGSQAKLDALKPYLTLSAWVDRKVIRPNCTAGMIDKAYHSVSEWILDYREDVPGSRGPGFERIQGKVVGRSPVNLAWARTRKPVLYALLADLSGLWLEYTTSPTPIAPNPPNATGSGPSPTRALASPTGPRTTARKPSTTSRTPPCPSAPGAKSVPPATTSA